MEDFTRLPIGTSSWLELVDHALALGDLSEVDWLELKGRLPFGERQGRKRSAVVLARAILGFANRMPDVAARLRGGHGIVLVGVDGAAVVGAEEVDPAVLRDAITPYLGENGPRWDHHYIEHQSGRVLAIVVNPPSWGDRIHTCRKEYTSQDGGLKVRDGDVFIHVPGITRPATSHDLAELERRHTRSPVRDAKPNVAYVGTFDRIRSDSVRALVAGVVNREAEALLNGLPTGSPYGSALAQMAAQMSDARSSEEFQRSVEEWRAESFAAADAAAAEFFRHQLARGRFKVTNESSRYLVALRVQIEFPPGVLVLMESDTDYCDHGGRFQFLQVLPRRPAGWGRSVFAESLYGGGISQRDIVARSAAEFTVEERNGGALITWHVGDLRPGTEETGDELFAIATDECSDRLVAHWRVTARGIDHVFTGSTIIECEQEESVHLMWSRPRDGGLLGAPATG